MHTHARTRVLSVIFIWEFIVYLFVFFFFVLMLFTAWTMRPKINILNVIHYGLSFFFWCVPFFLVSWLFWFTFISALLFKDKMLMCVWVRRSAGLCVYVYFASLVSLTFSAILFNIKFDLRDCIKCNAHIFVLIHVETQPYPWVQCVCVLREEVCSSMADLCLL